MYHSDEITSPWPREWDTGLVWMWGFEDNKADLESSRDTIQRKQTSLDIEDIEVTEVRYKEDFPGWLGLWKWVIWMLGLGLCSWQLNVFPRKELLYPVLWLRYEISKLNLAWLDHLETQVGPKDAFCPITFRAWYHSYCGTGWAFFSR